LILFFLVMRRVLGVIMRCTTSSNDFDFDIFPDPGTVL